MNLVAKEYVASRKDARGALILSSMAGAAKELQDAITINPFDTELTGEKIALALNMPEEVQEKRQQEDQGVHHDQEAKLAAWHRAQQMLHPFAAVHPLEHQAKYR